MDLRRAYYVHSGSQLFSLGYLAKTSRILLISNIGLPTWEDRAAIWINGIKLLFCFYSLRGGAFFLFSTGFFPDNPR